MATCVGSNYNVQYLTGRPFTGGTIGYDINQVAAAYGINPATLATISSLETGSLTGPDVNNDSYGCNPCNAAGAGGTQIGQNMFDAWNASQGGGNTFCSSICGAPGSLTLRNNLDICAQYLKAAFDLATSQGGYNDVQKMAAAATSWNGFVCAGNPNGYFYPFPGQYGYGLPGTSQMSDYGSTAGYLYQNSGLEGGGVYDTSQLLPQ